MNNSIPTNSKMDQFLEMHYLLKLTQEKIDNLNRLTFRKKELIK